MMRRYVASFFIAVLGLCCANLSSATAVTLDIRVNASADDATQNSSGTMSLTGATMQFTASTWMGMRFNSVTIPQGAYIYSAYITFRATSTQSVATTPTIYGQNVANATTFTTGANNISSRARTSASVSWNIPAWTNGNNYNSASIRTIVQEIVNRSDWASGNSLAVLINTLTAGANRQCRAWNGSTTLCPLLHVEYVVVTRPIANRLLFVVTNSASLTAQETARRTMFQDIGYTVTNISATASQGTFDTNAAANDLAYISEEITSTDLNTKLKGKSLGILNEEPALADDFAVASAYGNFSYNALTIESNTHYITSAFSLGLLTMTTSNQQLVAYGGTLAPDIKTIGTITSFPMFCTVEMNDELYDGTRAAGRRVLLPWGGGSFDINALGLDGINLLSRTLAWAGGVIAYWKVDETTGTTANDASVNLRHGTLGNFTFDIGTIASAKVNRGLRYDGANDYVSATNATVFQVTKALSISAWIKGDSWGSGSDVDVILRKGDGSPNNWQLAVEDGYVALHLDGNDGSGVRGNTQLKANRWYHVVGTWDGSNVRIYVNGVLDMTPTARAAPILTDTRPVYVGGRNGSDMFDGILDDVRMYNHAIQPDEIDALVAQGAYAGALIIEWTEIP
jgi:hypothetical protein